MTTDLELLRAHEPVVHYTEGELFFPTGVEGYLKECDLWVGSSQEVRRLLVPVGELTPDLLATQVAPPDESLFLRLVQKPLNGRELQRWTRRPERPHFRAPGRLARVGIFARLVDAGFTMSLLLRGTVPGGTAAAASIKYERVRAADPRYIYHGRVVRRDGWIVLHYSFFYFMNDYRSTFSGANDHESDWEQVFVYLEDRPEGPRPVWIAAAAHDYHGDDLRRRWDDPTLVKHRDHPVLFAGAGSHASYFEQGEYMTFVPIPALRGVPGFLGALRDFWRDTLRQPDPGDLAARLSSALSVPFIDYARGDGKAIGPGQPEAWTPALIDDSVPWVDGYRGLFGLDTYDRFAGERAPAGPKYKRSGTVRESWQDPLGFAGLVKVPPPFRAPEVLARTHRFARDRSPAATAQALEVASAQLPELGLEVEALAIDGAMSSLHAARSTDLLSAEAEYDELQRKSAHVTDTILAARRELERLEAGELGDPTAHLHHAQHPFQPRTPATATWSEIWSAISISLILITIVGLLYFHIVPWWAAFLIGVGGYVLLESAFRRRLTLLVLRTSLILAVIGAVLLALIYAELVVVAAIVALALIVFADNIREVARR